MQETEMIEMEMKTCAFDDWEMKKETISMKVNNGQNNFFLLDNTDTHKRKYPWKIFGFCNPLLAMSEDTSNSHGPENF